MNFIELLFHLKLEKTKFSDLSAKEIIKIEKIILAEKAFSENINNYDVEKLLLAIKKFPKQLDDLLNNENLLNMFSGKAKVLAKISGSSLTTEEGIPFFDEILKEDFEFEFKRRMALNDYKSLNNIMVYSKMFSFDFMYNLENQLTEKIKGANRFFRDGNFRNTKEYDFIIHSAFFALISHFPSEDIENAILSLYNKVVDAYNEFKHKPAKFALDCLVSFSYFSTANDSFEETLRGNKKIALDMLRQQQFDRSNQPKKESKFRQKTRGIPWMYIFVAFLFLKFGLKAFIGSSDTPETTISQNFDLQTNSGVMKNTLFMMDSVFLDYLAVVDTSLINYSKVETLKYTQKWENPFDKVKMNNQDYILYPEVSLKNTTGFDLVILQYALIGETPLYSDAYFLPKNDMLNIKVSKKDQYGYPINYLLYFGNDLANYGTKMVKNNTYYNKKKIFKKDKKTPETRFLSVPESSREILNYHFNFYDDVTILEENNEIKIQSDSIQIFYNKDLKIPLQNSRDFTVKAK